MAFRKGRVRSSWRFAVPPFAIAPIEKIGGCRCCWVYGQGFVHLATSKMKDCFGLLAPVEAFTLQQRGTRQRSVKAKNGRKLLV
jgi:hypothetical protein